VTGPLPSANGSAAHTAPLPLPLPLPLAGVRVIELTTTVLGPYCGQLLAEFGADVVKVESPAGDINRTLSPGRSEGMSSQFLAFNSGKRSVVLDLKSASGLSAMRTLVAGADVFLHNMRPAAVRKLAIDYAALSAVNSRLVYCGLYGYSDRGEQGDQSAYDDIIQAAAGLAAQQGMPRGLPQYVVTTLCDKTVGLLGAYAICGALMVRDRTGAGQAVEVPMYEVMSGYTLQEQLGAYTFDPPIGPIGYPRTASPNRKPYRASDGFLAVMLLTDRQWELFLRAAGREDLITDHRFRSAAARTQNVDEVYAILEGLIAQRTVPEWLALCLPLGIPASPVRDVQEVAENEYLRSIEVIEAVDHPSEGAILRIRLPKMFSASGRASLLPAPRLGADTRDVLTETGLPATEVEQLTGHLHQPPADRAVAASRDESR
jgi:crotonobetainyl-CoA:carnitine CoA-transferase CaiB-like acyl-CoA transferase